MTYALRQQFQDMDRSVQSDERQKLADLAATQKRTDMENQRRIQARSPEASFDLPDSYQFGQQNAGGAPAPMGAQPQRPVVGSPAQTTITPTPGAWRGQRSDTVVEPERTHLWHAEGSTDVNTPYGESVGKALGFIGGLPMRALRTITSAPGQGLLTKDEEPTKGTSLAKLREKEVDRNVQAARQQAGKTSAQQPPAGSSFVDRIRYTESRGNVNAVGPNVPGQGTAKGDMQVMDRTNTDPGFGVTPARNNSPEERSRVGRDYAQALLNRYGNEQEAAAAYNWGPGNYDRWKASGANPAQMPAETRNYVAQVAGGQPGAQPSGQPPAQQAQAPAQSEATYSGMGPAGTPRALQEAIDLGRFRYQQLTEMLQNSPPEQQATLMPQRDALVADIRAKQAYMLAAQSDANPQALGQLVAMSGAQAARTQDGQYVMVDQNGRAVSPPMSGGQLGSYLYRALDEKSRAAQAEVQGKIALEQAKAQAKAQGDLAVQGMTTAEMERLKSLMRFYEEQNKPGETRAIADPSGGSAYYNTRQAPPAVPVNANPIR